MSLRLRERTHTTYRFFVISFTLLPLAITILRDQKRFLFFGSAREVSEEGHRRRAERLLDAFLELGPAFIKFGQVLSTRPDAIPRTYTETLSRLQDEVPPADWDDVRRVITEDIGDPDDVYDRFEREPISGASIAQVHVAWVQGTKVAVKVRRPGVRERIEADLRVMDAVLPFVLRFAKEGQRFTLENLADQFEEAIREETDFEREARSIDTIRENLADHDEVVVPRVAHRLSGERVITMEYIGGTKINDVDSLRARGIDPTVVVEDLQQAYIQMILEDGVFHADPHPGNLAVTDDGRVVFYDFGIVGRISDETRNNILDMYVAVSRGDVDNMINTFIDMDALDPEVDREIARRMFEVMLENMRGEDVDKERIEDLVDEIQSEMYEFPMRAPRELALLIRTSTLLEGVSYELDPDFDFVPGVRDYLVRKRLGPAGRALVGLFVSASSAYEAVTSWLGSGRDT